MLVRMAAIQKSTNNNCWRGCGEKGALLHSWWECKLVQPLWRTVWRFLKKLQIELPYDPAIPVLGIHTEVTRIKIDMCSSQHGLQWLGHGSNLDVHRQTNGGKKKNTKLWYLYTMEYYHAVKKNAFESV